MKNAAVSKKSVIRYMTVPKRHMYQYVVLVVPPPCGPTSDGGAPTGSGPSQAAPKGRAGAEAPQSRLEAPQMRKYVHCEMARAPGMPEVSARRK